jgi:hypothetical protein
MATRKSAPKQKSAPFTAPSGHKAVGVTPPFVKGKKPAPAAPVQAAPMKMNVKANKKGMC